MTIHFNIHANASKCRYTPEGVPTRTEMLPQTVFKNCRYKICSSRLNKWVLFGSCDDPDSYIVQRDSFGFNVIGEPYVSPGLLARQAKVGGPFIPYTPVYALWEPLEGSDWYSFARTLRDGTKAILSCVDSDGKAYHTVHDTAKFRAHQDALHHFRLGGTPLTSKMTKEEAIAEITNHVHGASSSYAAHQSVDDPEDVKELLTHVIDVDRVVERVDTWFWSHGQKNINKADLKNYLTEFVSGLAVYLTQE